MHNSLITNNIDVNRIYLQPKKKLNAQVWNRNFCQSDNNFSKDVSKNDTKGNKSKVVMYSLVGLAAVGAAGILIGNLKHGKVKASKVLASSTPSQPRNISLKGLEDFIIHEVPVNDEIYQFMKRSPRGFYLEYGQEVNKFLRKGTFEELPILDDDIPEGLRKHLEREITKRRTLNRTIVESIDVMDSKITSRTTEPMIVYRDAPRQWMNMAKDGILTDPAYLSTSTEKGASMEGMICNGADNFTYEIRLPKGTPFWDMTDTAEKEMLLGRNSKFKIISPGVLEFIL